MTFVGDITTVLLGTLTLVLLSLYTLVNCRQELTRQRPASDEFLFGGVARRHSLAGTIGYAFSITYFGATAIYGHLYRGWLIIVMITAIAIAIVIIQAVIRKAPGLPQSDGMRRNLLLMFIEQRLGKRNLRHVARLYVVIYFALLVEELAVSRVLLSIVFGGHPAVMALLLATICAVILAYLKWGGFRAVLVADFEQLKLLFPFVLAIAFLSFRSASIVSPEPLFAVRTEGNVLTYTSAVLMLVGWIVSSIDFYSRLNYSSNRKSMDGVANFASVSLAMTTAIFIVGACYGMMLPAEFSSDPTPSGFTARGVQYAVVLGYRSTAVIFFASAFCMIFSTVNTLTIATFQAARYAEQPWPQFRDLHKVMLWAVALSCILWPNSVSAIGLFICALMILPLLAILGALSQTLRRFLPADYSFLWFSLGVSTIGFALSYRFFTRYSNMPFLGALVLVSAAACAAAAKIYEANRGSYGSQGNT
jgi:hypothetical protein